jgi:hypothetical protein
MKTLHLSLKKDPFEVMITGEKDCEYREPSDWIKQRLLNKDGTQKKYEVVKFTNGYGKNRPSFTAEYKGFSELGGNLKTITYSNGLTVELKAGTIIIYLGKIISVNP